MNDLAYHAADRISIGKSFIIPNPEVSVGQNIANIKAILVSSYSTNQYPFLGMTLSSTQPRKSD